MDIIFETITMEMANNKPGIIKRKLQVISAAERSPNNYDLVTGTPFAPTVDVKQYMIENEMKQAEVHYCDSYDTAKGCIEKYLI